MFFGSGTGGIRSIIDFITYIGCSFLRLSAMFFRGLFFVIRFPVLLLAKGIVILSKAVVNFVKTSFREQVGNERYFTGRLYKSVKRLLSELKNNPKEAFRLLPVYIGKGMTHYRSIVKYVILIIIPAAAAVSAFITVNYFTNRCIALKIDTENGTLGYVASEDDYLEARSLAQQRLSIDSGSGDISASLLPDVSYSLALIQINEYTGTQTLCDRLIESSEENIVNACGIYIDGDFFCAVKNEADAKRVFNSVLEDSPDYGDNAIVTFIQDIDYVEGLYPDTSQTVWDSSRLSEAVKDCAEGNLCYTATEGDTLEKIAESKGLTLSELTAMNPDIDTSGTVTEGQRVLIGHTEKSLTVKTIKTEVSNEKIAFSTEEILSDALYVGTKRTVVSGVDGVAQITHLVTYIDGKKISSEEVSRITVQEPVNKRIQVGTKPLDASYNYSSGYGGIFVWPAVNAFNINSPYGYRWGTIHRGIDIGSSTGTSTGKLIVAAASGTVVSAGYQSSYGYYVQIDHGNGIRTGYAHCLENSIMVYVGQHVDAGQAIARIGQSGHATGPHLHFEVIINGSRVDPAPFLGIG